MSKSLGNTIAPQDVIKQSGADILRLWVASADYWDDQRIGPEILKQTIETYRKLRNTVRWMLGSLAHFHEDERVKREHMPELERLMLHRLAELDELVRKAYAEFDYKRIFSALNSLDDLGPVGVLFRHPQGRALLRSLFINHAQGLSHCARPIVPLHGDLACAAALLYRGGILDRALWRGGEVGASRIVPGGAGRLARRQTGRQMAQGPHCAPRRHRRAGDRARAKTHRLLARGAPDRARLQRGALRGGGRYRSRRSLHHLGGDAGGG